MLALRIVIDVLIAAGLFFAAVGTVGIIKMPDTFCRMQASTCVPTLGMLLTAIGGALYAVIIMGSISACIKIVVIALLVLLFNPVGSHMIARAAYRSGIRPEKELKPDDYGRDFDFHD